jgi:hypothetical protein
MPSARGPIVRRLVAGAASLALSLGMLLTLLDKARPQHWWEAIFAGLLVASPVLAASIVWHRGLAAQLFSRACWWSYLVVGVMASIVGFPPGSHGATAVVWCCGLALLAVGRDGLDETASRFQPVAFRGTLLLSLVLAIADAAALTSIGLMFAIEEHRLVTALPVAALMWLGVAGLVRLRTWGLMVALASNVLVVILAVTKTYPFLHAPGVLFGATAVAQLLVPLPMLATLVLRRPPAPDRWRRAKVWGTTAVIVGLAAVSLYMGVVRHALLLAALRG